MVGFASALVSMLVVNALVPAAVGMRQVLQVVDEKKHDVHQVQAVDEKKHDVHQVQAVDEKKHNVTHNETFGWITAERYCIHCKGGRHIYMKRTMSKMQMLGMAVSFATKASVAVLPHHGAIGAVWYTLKTLQGLAKLYSDTKDIYDLIMSTAGPDEVSYLTMAWADNGERYSSNGWPLLTGNRVRARDIKYIDLPQEQTGNEVIDSLFLFKKNWQDVWVTEVGCYTWKLCTSIDMNHDSMSPASLALIDAHEGLCGGDQKGVSSHYSGVVKLYDDLSVTSEKEQSKEEGRCLNGHYWSRR